MPLILTDRRHISAGDIIRLMRRGFNTLAIAEMHGVEEYVIWNILALSDGEVKS
jgi:hypothetical protein